MNDECPFIVHRSSFIVRSLQHLRHIQPAGALAVGGEPDHVDCPHRPPVGGLPLGEALDGAQAVAKARGLLEALLGRGGSQSLLLADLRAAHEGFFPALMQGEL